MSGNSDIWYSFWEPEGFVFKQSKTKTYSLYKYETEKAAYSHIWEAGDYTSLGVYHDIWLKLLAGLSNVLSFTPPCLFLDGIQYVQYSMSS